ncbi:hypothetical protein AB0957_33165, partial [Streptomyces zhihengii]
VMTRGRLVAEGSVAELAAGARGRLVVLTPDPARVRLPPPPRRLRRHRGPGRGLRANREEEGS